MHSKDFLFCTSGFISLRGPLYFLNIYLFLLICLAASGLSSACRLFVAAHGLLSSCDTWAVEREGSVVVAHGLSCPEACRILVPRPGIEPTFPALEGGFLTTGPPGKSPTSFYVC